MEEADGGLHQALAQGGKSLGLATAEVFEVGGAEAAAQDLQMELDVLLPGSIERSQDISADSAEIIYRFCSPLFSFPLRGSIFAPTFSASAF